MPNLTIIEAINLALKQEMARNKKIILLGEDIGVNGGVFRATDGLWKEFGPDRVVDTPLAELGIIGSSIGLAMAGFKSVPEIQFEGFTYSTFEQIISHAGRMRNRSRGKLTVPMVLRSPYGGGIHAPEHHSESPEAYFAHSPGLKVVIPSTPYDAKGLMISALRETDPVIFFEPKKIYRAFRQEVPETDYTVPIGKASLVREGTDATVLAWGPQVRNALQAAEKLATEGKQIEVIDVRSICPLDLPTILASVEKTGRCVIVHEAPRTCGFGAELSALIAEKSLLSLKAPVERVTGFDTPMPLYKMENHFLPSPERIAAGIQKVLNF